MPYPIAAHRLPAEHDVAESLRRMGSDSEAEILAMLPADGCGAGTARMLARQRDEDLAAAGRGVDTRLLCEAAAVEPTQVRAELERRAEAGIRVHVVPQIPQWISVFDRRVAVLRPASGRGEAIVVREQPMVTSVRSLFAGLWRRSGDLFRQQQPACTGRDRLVLSLMGSGVTDESSARRMDVSVRTYRRYVADVMTVLGATSRFQAGVLAAQRGWI